MVQLCVFDAKGWGVLQSEQGMILVLGAPQSIGKRAGVMFKRKCGCRESYGVDGTAKAWEGGKAKYTESSVYMHDIYTELSVYMPDIFYA